MADLVRLGSLVSRAELQCRGDVYGFQMIAREIHEGKSNESDRTWCRGQWVKLREQYGYTRDEIWMLALAFLDTGEESSREIERLVRKGVAYYDARHGQSD